MRGKINRLSKGIFDKDIPELEISKGLIEDTMKTDGVLSGSFVITSALEARGMLYTDTGRIVLKEHTFCGKHAEIHYEIHSRGMLPGERIKGCIWIISDGGEFTLPCEVQVEAPFAMTSMGKIRNIFHFTNLVRNNYEEAKRLFCSPEFAEIFLTGNPQAKNVYEALKKGSCADTAMEEFLVYINKKSRIFLSVDAEKKEYDDFEHSQGGELVLTKSSWGYVPIEAEADGAFIHLEKKQFSSEVFTGSIYRLAYTIEEEKVHPGLNLGKITIRTPYQELQTEIVVRRRKESAGQKNREQDACLAELAKQYFAFRLRKINTDTWCRQSLRLTGKLRSMSQTALFPELLQIQLLLTQKKKGEAAFIIKNLESRITGVKEKNPELYAYFLYLKVLCVRDGRTLKETLLTVRRMYDSGQDSWQILWVLLYLDEEYTQNGSLKLVRIKEQYAKGCRSPFLYYEACSAVNEQPALLRILNDFEQQAVWWGVKHRMLSEKAGLRIAELAVLEKRSTLVVFRILEGLCEQYNNPLILESLLSLLLREGRIGAKYCVWYEKGIEEKITLTGLYEAYLYSLPEDYKKPVPKLAAMYLAFDESLGDEARETLYENLYTYEQENASILQNNLAAIEQFTAGQIIKGRMNRRLAFLYRKAGGRLLLDEELAAAYPKILLSRYISVPGKSGRVIVRHKECDREISAVLEKSAGGVCLPVYTEDAAILYEDERGRRFLISEDSSVQPLMNEEALVRSCYELCKGDVLLWLHICEKEGIYRTGEEPGIDIYKRVVDSPLVDRDCRNQLYQRIIEYYMENYDGDRLEEQLLRMDMSGMSEKERCHIIELLINRSMYEEAYTALRTYGYEEITLNRLLKLCIYVLWAGEGREDKFLTELCAYVFSKGKYDETILGYLLKYYQSTTKNLLKLWQAAKDFNVNTTGLEERLLTQMLFTGSYAVRAIDVFESYYYNHTSRILVKAYLSWRAYQYFRDNLLVNEKLFGIIEREYYREERDVTDICKLALLRYYSEQEKLEYRQIELAKNLMQMFLNENKRFGFYKKFERWMELPPYLRDKTIVEYQSNTENIVEIHYILDAGISVKKVYEISRMEKSYATFYIKELILFYGEHLQYYISERGEDGERLTESASIVMDRFDSADGESRYHLLNDICACMEMHDEKTLRNLMVSYAEKQRLTEEFELL